MTTAQMLAASQTGVFTRTHITGTAALTALLVAAVAAWGLPRTAWLDILAAAVLSGAAVWLWRASANMPQLNADGLSPFSADDWLAPVVVYVVLAGYADLRQPADQQRFRQVCALAALIAFAVNVITI